MKCDDAKQEFRFYRAGIKKVSRIVDANLKPDPVQPIDFAIAAESNSSEKDSGCCVASSEGSLFP